MHRTRPARLPLRLLLLLCLPALAACEDPSGVGLTVLDPGETDPRARVVRADSAGLVPFDDFTGSFIGTAGFSDFRGLAGRVVDPLFGTTEARAYIDFLPPQSFPEGFRTRPIERAQLRLVRAYAYGDTTTAVTLDLFDVTGEWDSGSAASDTLFPVADAAITSFEVAAADSLVEVELPDAWITAMDTTLRHANVSTLFHGFQISPRDAATAVVGFSGRSELRLISDDDTVRFAASELFSNIEWEPPAAPEPDGIRPLQDGTGRGFEVQFDLDTLRNVPINTALIRVDVDTTYLAQDLPAGFVRSRPTTLTLFARSGPADTDDLGVVTTARFDPETSTFTFSGSTLTSLFQRLVLGQSDLDRFVIAFPSGPSSLDALPLVVPESADDAPGDGQPVAGPRAVLVVVPTDA